MTVNAPVYHARIEPSGRTFEVAADETVLAAGLRAGVNLPYGCKDGACGSCRVRVLAGQVSLGTHQDKALPPADQALGYTLTCCAKPLSDLTLEARQVTAEGTIAPRMMPVRVRAIQRLAPDVIALTLQTPASEVLRFHAGQYVEFLLRDGQRRSYSMACAPHRAQAEGAITLHIRHMPGGLFTDQVFGSMKERDILRIEGPMGSFYLREGSSQPMIWLASGTGFAPIQAILEHSLHTGASRPTWLYWGGRRPQDLYARDWLAGVLAQAPWLHFVPVVSDALPEDAWSGRTGFVHRAVLDDHPDLSGFEVYACGAPVMVHAARQDFAAAGLAEDAFYADAFTSAADQAT